ncbi:MAG: squalene--hopene cyclase, partial [Kiritimatiellae bacterium]|nr:squalene--hopene cyclase [Kiritimatiellia bacterium]
DSTVRIAGHLGIRWLLTLQNCDGGIPTFCRGWGRLLFDRSCPDVTAHALRAFDEWYDDLVPAMRGRVDAAMHRAVTYLSAVQRNDGSWLPLWFGNQQVPGEGNPTYGTATVVRTLAEITPDRLPHLDPLVEKGAEWLARNQNHDGGWGGGGASQSSVEETALAVRALVNTTHEQEVLAGVRWLIEATDCGRIFPATPIGLYFASLWYSEKLYPIIFTLSALKAVALRYGVVTSDIDT